MKLVDPRCRTEIHARCRIGVGGSIRQLVWRVLPTYPAYLRDGFVVASRVVGLRLCLRRKAVEIT